MPGYTRGYKRQRSSYGRYKKRVYRKKTTMRRSSGAPDYTVTRNRDIIRAIPGTYRTTKSWARSVPGAIEVKNKDLWSDAGGALSGGAALFSNYNYLFGPSHICRVAQGTAKYERVGRKINVKGIKVKAWVNFIGKSTSFNFGTIACRLILFIDTQTNGTATDLDDLLETSGQGTYPKLSDVFTYYNLDNVQRFKILYDKTYQPKPQQMLNNSNTVNATAITNAIAANEVLYEPLFIKINKKLSMMPIEFSGTAGTIDEVRSNSIQLAVMVTRWDEEVGGAGPNSGILVNHKIHTRMTYTDL